MNVSWAMASGKEIYDAERRRRALRHNSPAEAEGNMSRLLMLDAARLSASRSGIHFVGGVVALPWLLVRDRSTTQQQQQQHT